MNEFLKLILYELQSAVGLAIAASVICTVGICLSAVIFRVKYKGERRFPLRQAVVIAVFVGYIAALLCLTVLRTSGYSGMNVHLFRAWREAWNIYSFQNWANVLLNVAMFIPLGVLLPLMWRAFRRWYVTFGASLLTTLTIEILQFLTRRGMFDVDDIFANFLGAIFGYCAVMVVISAVGDGVHKVRRVAEYSVIPLITVASISFIFIVYNVQPYGNLAGASSYRVPTGDAEWSLSCELSDAESTAKIYRAKTRGKDASDAFGIAFLRSLGADGDSFSFSYYDDTTYISDNMTASVFISHRDLSCEYNFFKADGDDAVTDRETIESLLSEYGIAVPAEASFTAEGDGWYSFVFDWDDDGDVAGKLRCKCIVNGNVIMLKHVTDNMTEREYIADERIISQREAYERMVRGDFAGDFYTYTSPARVTVTLCYLDSEIDSKGYYQPVWRFLVEYDGVEAETIMIPAIK